MQVMMLISLTGLIFSSKNTFNPVLVYQKKSPDNAGLYVPYQFTRRSHLIQRQL